MRTNVMASNDVTHVPLLIIGAGMAGLGAGIQAQRLGRKSLILESSNKVGGLCQNSTVHGCDFDFGPKILLLDDSVNAKDILSFLGDNSDEFPVNESAYLSDYGLLGFPIQRNLIDLPDHERQKVLDSIEYARGNPRELRSYKDWLINGYGEYLCKKVLFPYEEKKWQTSLDKLDFTWALRRPVKVDIDEVRTSAVRRLPNTKKYYYPRQGNISSLSNAMAEQAGPILLSHSVQAIDLDRKRVVAGGRVFSYDRIVSSMPLDHEVAITNQFDEETKSRSKANLQRLGIRVFNLVFDGNYDLSGTAIYFAEKKFIFRRVSILENLCPALSRENMTPISVEISLDPNAEPMDSSQQLKLIMKHLALIPQFAQLVDNLIAHEILEVDFAYPMQNNGLRDFVADIHAVYRDAGVYHCGRGGNFDYCNSDVAYEQGKQAVDEAVAGIT